LEYFIVTFSADYCQNSVYFGTLQFEVLLFVPVEGSQWLFSLNIHAVISMTQIIARKGPGSESSACAQANLE
jgi:hypothetical protein